MATKPYRLETDAIASPRVPIAIPKSANLWTRRLPYRLVKMPVRPPLMPAAPSAIQAQATWLSVKPDSLRRISAPNVHIAVLDRPIRKALQHSANRPDLFRMAHWKPFIPSPILPGGTANQSQTVTPPPINANRV